MKKALALTIALVIAFTISVIPIKAYSPIGKQEIQAYSANTTIVSDTQPMTNWYRFVITYNQAYNARYILFSSTESTTVFLTTTSLENFSNVMLGNTTKMARNWYLYLGTLTTYYAWVYSTGGGAAAQAQLQSYINNDLYYYYDLTNTIQNDVIDSFVNRYKTLDDSETFNAGYLNGYNVGYDEARSEFGLYMDGIFWGYNFPPDWYSAEFMFDFAKETFFDLGFLEGQENANNSNLAILSFIPSIIGAIGSFFLTIASFEFLGVSILGVLIVMATVGFVLIALKFIRG